MRQAEYGHYISAAWERLKREYLEAVEDLEAAHQEHLEWLAASARRRRAWSERGSGSTSNRPL
jgi:hypothetical protein